MGIYQSKNVHPNRVPRQPLKPRLAEFTRRHPRLTYGSLALVLASVVAAGADTLKPAGYEFDPDGHETHPVTTNTCHINSFTDTGEKHELKMPDGRTITVDRVIVDPVLELTPQTEEHFREEGDKLEVRARQFLPGGTEIGQTKGRYDIDWDGHREVVLEPPVTTPKGALMEFTVGGVTCEDGLVKGKEQWEFAGQLDQYEPRLQRGAAP